jgi:hypothetical protein
MNQCAPALQVTTRARAAVIIAIRSRARVERDNGAGASYGLGGSASDSFVSACEPGLQPGCS